tara:strand:+ start:822 stop:1196 length:375 start_codon:yes stop_codon:yes gene_type:complete
MDYNSDFKYDLEVGKEGERIVADLFKNKTIEVKRDFWVGRTGNIAVEFQSRKKPSGILTTEADYWVFVFSAEYEDKLMLVVETEKLKKITKVFAIRGLIKEMGDNNSSLAVLIPIKELSKFATI